MSTFPWDTVKAETLRSIARDIGISPTHKRDEMIHLFRMVAEDGRMCRIILPSMFGVTLIMTTVDAAVEEEKELRVVASSKRKADFDSPPRPKRTRRSDPGPAKMVTRYKGVRTKTYRTTTAQPKPRTRTRPRRAPAAKGTSARVVGKFDGVVLPRRRLGKPKRQEGPPPVEADGEGGDDVDADGDGDADVDADADGDVDHDVELPDHNQAEVQEGSEPLGGEGSEKGESLGFLGARVENVFQKTTSQS